MWLNSVRCMRRPSRNASAPWPGSLNSPLRPPFGLPSSPLSPWQANGLPASHGSAMTVGIEWPLESFRNIPALPETKTRHGLGSRPATRARTANKQNLVVLTDALTAERRLQARSELRIDLALRIRLPLLRQDSLAQLRQVGQADERPLRLRTHINENCFGILIEPFPRIGDGHILNVDNPRSIHHFSAPAPSPVIVRNDRLHPKLLNRRKTVPRRLRCLQRPSKD